MKNITRRAFLALALFAITAPCTTQAEEDPRANYPYDMRNDPTTEQNGITYLLHEDFAVVIATPNRRTVTIPHAIRYADKRYTVLAIWDGTFSETPKLRRVKLKARNLETIEDPRIFEDASVQVICYDRATYEWLNEVGVNAVCKQN